MSFTPLNDTSRRLLLKLINKANSLQLPDTFLDLGDPLPLSPPEQAEYGHNTKVLLTANPGATHLGTETVYYDRLDIGQVFQKYPKVPVTQPFANSFEALTQINELYGLVIDPNEIVGIQAIDYAVRITIRDSYLWLPGSYIEVAVNINEALLVDIEDFTHRLWTFTNFDFPPIITTPMGDYQ
jgi:hypothetical protein